MKHKTKAYLFLALVSIIFGFLLSVFIQGRGIGIVTLLVISYILYVFGDLISTKMVLEETGTTESNPLLRRVFNKTSVFTGGFIIKNLIFLGLVVIIFLSSSSSNSNLIYVTQYLYPSLLISVGLLMTVNNTIKYITS